MSAHIVAEGQVALDVRAARLVDVQVVRAKIVRALIEKTPAGDAIFPDRVVAQLAQARVERIHGLNVVDDHQHVDDGLRADTRNGRGAEMVD